jgi:hypothetical protein
MKHRGIAPGIPRALAWLAPLVLVGVAACAAEPQPAETLPAGTDPDKIRFFCTQESDRAAGFVGYPPDYLAQRRRAADDAFAACMARHNVRP